MLMECSHGKGQGYLGPEVCSTILSTCQVLAVTCIVTKFTQFRVQLTILFTIHNFLYTCDQYTQHLPAFGELSNFFTHLRITSMNSTSAMP